MLTAAVVVRVGGVAAMGEALIIACINGQAREVRRLLSGGTDVNDVNEQGATPLMAASANGNVEVVDMLLAVEANVHAASHDESTIQILDMWPCDPIDLFSADNLFNAEYKYACSVEFLQKSKAGWGTVGLTLDVAFPPVVVAER